MSRVCWIDIREYESMIDDAKKHHPLETGGVLCGYIADNGDYVITKALLGGPKAERRALSFAADTKWQREQCDKVWDETKGTEFYIGDWHTHPGHRPILSSADIKCLKVISDEPTCIDNPLMFILGGRDFFDIGVYRYPAILLTQKMVVNTFCPTTVGCE